MTISKQIQQLQTLTTKLTTIRRGNAKQLGLAPHKPLLLLAIIDLIQEQQIRENNIPIDKALFDHFNHNWNLLVHTGHDSKIIYPIYHLQNDRLWTAWRKSGEQINDVTSKIHLSHGQLEDSFFQLLQEKEFPDTIRMILLDTYFPDTKFDYLAQRPIQAYINEIEQAVLENSKSKYKKTMRITEGFVRDWKFRDSILKVYDHTCCMSKFRIIPNFAIIEASHIQPHAQFGINTITNGIPLCINLHRSFDLGLISINDNYQILIKNKKTFQENDDSPYNLRQLAGQQILLPENEKFYPDLEKLKWHREEYGF